MWTNEEKIEADTSKGSGAMLQQKLLDARTVFIFGEIDQELAEKVCKQLILLQEISDEKITIFINSQGGHVEAGDTIHDMIRFIKPEVQIVGTGWVASAGVTIFLGAKKENRFALPNTRFMIHQVAGGAQGQITDLELETKEVLRMHDRLIKLISDATGQPAEKVEKDINRNYWMSNAEAEAYGIVHKVIETKDELPK